MAKIEDYAFTIGYDGPQAVVDSRAQRDNAGLGVGGLFEKGLFRAAFATALKAGDDAALKDFMDRYNRLSGSSYKSQDEFSRLFGVFPADEGKAKRF